MRLLKDKRHGSILMFVLFCITACLAGCQKEEWVRFSTDLALNAQTIRVADSAGTTRLQVYSDGDWKVLKEEEAAWVSFDRTAGKGKGDVVVSFQSNKDQLPRAVKILISSGDKTDTVIFQQKGLAPELRFDDDSAVGIGNGGELKTVLATNVPFGDIGQNISYETGSDWISGLKMEGKYLKVNLSANTQPEVRNGKILLFYKDAFGSITKDSILVTQNPKGAYENAVLKDFAFVKTMLAAGTILDDIYIEGIVMSDKGNPNMGLNLNKATNKHEMDKTENAITVYIQSLDGRSGIHLRTRTAGDNVYGRFEKVKLWLKDLTLRKETNPSRVILDNVPSLNVMSKEPGQPVSPRQVYIRDLTDEDLFTYVKLKDVEISVPSGSYFNINEGYNLRTGTYPMNIRDINGNSLYVMTNIDVPYRRGGKRVPQGSGDISGILVYEQLQRYGGNLGRYSIRHLTEADISLQQSRESGFSNVLVEWSRFKNEFVATPSAEQNPLTPDIGNGVLTHSEKGALDFSSAGIYAGTDYNALAQEPSGAKGAVSNGAWAVKSWWNTAKNRGSWWLIRVSTKGITTPVSLQIEGHNDIGGPRNFIVEWSETGDENGVWNQVGEYTLEDVVNWANTLLTQVPGMKVVNFQFPLAASGLDNLFIRLRVKNRVAGTATNPTGASLGATTASRLSHVSIKYNK